MASPTDPIKDQTAVMPDGSKFSFFDTGAPDGEESYKTYLLLHGLCFNKRTWRDMVGTKDESVRLVAFSLRGYEGCSDFNEPPENHVIGPTLGSDFISMVTYVVKTLQVLANKDSILSIIAWSLAAASIVAGYGSLIEPSGIVQKEWTSYISNIVFYEPAGGRAFGLPYWAAGSTPNPPMIPPRDPVDGFKRLAASYYEYDEAFFSRPCPTGIHDPEDTVYISSCLIDTDPLLWDVCVDGIFEPGPYGRYSKLSYSETKPGSTEPDNRKAFAREALTVMANTAIKTIHGISTKHTLTGCTIGTKYLEDLIKATQPDKWHMTWIEGHNNHFVHNLEPESLWTAIKETEAKAIG